MKCPSCGKKINKLFWYSKETGKWELGFAHLDLNDVDLNDCKSVPSFIICDAWVVRDLRANHKDDFELCPHCCTAFT